MAVYTHVSAEVAAAFLAEYDLGTLVSLKGIAEGVENSNYLVVTRTGSQEHRYILTIYEKRVDAGDLPFFLGIMTQGQAAGLPIPRPILARDKEALRTIEGRPACLIEFLNGVSVSSPSTAQARAAGSLLARFHLALSETKLARDDTLMLEGWDRLGTACAEKDETYPERELVDSERVAQRNFWSAADTQQLPHGIIHADLFPDNVLFTGDEVTGMIDFYFAATGAFVYDIAVMINSWAMVEGGDSVMMRKPIADALLAGYAGERPLTDAEETALPMMLRAAALRFLLTRRFDALHPATDALVKPKDPKPFADRLRFFRLMDNAAVFQKAVRT